MSALGQISRVKHISRKDILVSIINSLVFSKLYYCSSVWSITSASNIRNLQGVQNFAACIVSGTRKFDHVSPALKDLGWIPFKSHLYLRDAFLAFKSMTGQVPNYLWSVHATEKKEEKLAACFRSTAGLLFLCFFNFLLYRSVV